MRQPRRPPRCSTGHRGCACPPGSTACTYAVHHRRWRCCTCVGGRAPPPTCRSPTSPVRCLPRITAMTFEELENPAGSDTSRMLHHVAWHATPFRDEDRPTDVALVGGSDDETTRCWSGSQLQQGCLAARMTASRPGARRGGARVGGASSAADRRLAGGGRRAGAAHTEAPAPQRFSGAAVGADATGARGANLVHAPLWGMARVAAAEHPQLWGGVLDLGRRRAARRRAGFTARPRRRGGSRRHGPDRTADTRAARRRRADDVHAGRHLSDHRWHGRARPADRAAPRRPRRTPPGAAVPVGHAARASSGAPRAIANRYARSRRWRSAG